MQRLYRLAKEMNGLDHLAFNDFVDQCFDFNFENDCPRTIFNLNALIRQVYKPFSNMQFYVKIVAFSVSIFRAPRFPFIYFSPLRPLVIFPLTI